MTEDAEWMRLLRELFGDRADEAVLEMRRMGIDPEALGAASGLSATPAMMEHVLAQLRAVLEQSRGQDVNWTLAHDVARGVAAHGGDPSVSAAQAESLRGSVSRAELWLDAATELPPSTLTPHVWSRAEWVEATLPTWRRVAGPVAISVSSALSALFTEAADATDDATLMLEQIAPTVTGMHVGQAAGAMAREAFGGTDLGLLLVPEPRAVMIPDAITHFAENLDIPVSEVQDFLALRECAHVRLFQRAPWLAGQLVTAIEKYASAVEIDPDALDAAVQRAHSGDPASIQKAMSQGIFASHHSEAQQEALRTVETLLALIEGWVETGTALAASAHLDHVPQLVELIRRRRAASGPAEDAFATLLGLDLRPRRLREAAAMWGTLGATEGSQARDTLWSHPDLLPTSADLDDWRTWIDVRPSARPDDIDAELRTILDEADPRDSAP